MTKITCEVPESSGSKLECDIYSVIDMTKVTCEVPESTEGKLECDIYSVIVSIRHDKGYLWGSREH